MKSRGLDEQWRSNHRVLWFVCLGCIAYATGQLCNDVFLFIKGETFPYKSYVIALCVGFIVWRVSIQKNSVEDGGDKRDK